MSRARWLAVDFLCAVLQAAPSGVCTAPQQDRAALFCSALYCTVCMERMQHRAVYTAYPDRL